MADLMVGDRVMYVLDRFKHLKGATGELIAKGHLFNDPARPIYYTVDLGGDIGMVDFLRGEIELAPPA